MATGAVVVSCAQPAHLPQHGRAVPGRAPAAQAQALVNQLEVVHGRGPIRFDPTGLRYAEPFSGLIMAQLQDLGVPLVVDDEVLVRQLGEGRRDDGEARFSLREVEGA